MQQEPSKLWRTWARTRSVCIFRPAGHQSTKRFDDVRERDVLQSESIQSNGSCVMGNKSPAHIYRLLEPFICIRNNNPATISTTIRIVKGGSLGDTLINTWCRSCTYRWNETYMRGPVDKLVKELPSTRSMCGSTPTLSKGIISSTEDIRSPTGNNLLTAQRRYYKSNKAEGDKSGFYRRDW